MNIRLLKQRDFSLLMMGKLVSLIGSRMQGFALSLYVLKITGSATKFASVLAITLIPSLILGPVAGVFADWLDKKKTIVFLDMLSGIVVGIFAVVFRNSGELSIIYIYILVIMLSMISLLFGPAITTIVPTIVNKEELMEANSIQSFIMNIGNFIAPIIAGILLGAYGLYMVMVINSISFILSAVSEMFINIPKMNNGPKEFTVKSFLNDFSQGIEFIKSKKIILNIISLGVIVNFACSPIISIGIPYISKKVLKVTDSQYGLFQSILVISLLIAPFVCTLASQKIKIGKIVFLDIFIVSILFGLMAVVASPLYLDLFVGNFVPYSSMIIICFVLTIIISAGNIAMFTMLQQQVPLEIMGRVRSAMNTGTMAAIPLGQMLYGILFDKIDTWMCVGISAVLLLITIIFFRKNLYDYKEMENKTVENSREIELA